MSQAHTQQPSEPVAASLGDIVAIWDQHAPGEYMTALHMQAKRALAGQQPTSPDKQRWCQYVAGMIAGWLDMLPDQGLPINGDARTQAIAGIIERRLWAMPNDAHPAPTQQPLTVTGCSYCLNKTAYKLTPTCTECGHDMLPANPAPTQQPLTEKQRRAVVVCFTSGKVSVSEVQRKLAIGYAESQTLCQSIVNMGLAEGLQLCPTLTRPAAHGITGSKEGGAA